MHAVNFWASENCPKIFFFLREKCSSKMKNLELENHVLETDSYKFLTGKIADAQNVNFAATFFSKMGV